MIFSAFAFWWVPFLQLRAGTATDNPIGMVLPNYLLSYIGLCVSS